MCHWLGNSMRVARRHYLQTTDEHYSQALQNPVHEALQKEVQQPAATKEKKNQKALPVAALRALLRLAAIHPKKRE